MTCSEERLGMKVGGFWSQGVTAVFDVRVSETPREEDLKKEEPYLITITWIRTLLSFEILMSVHTGEGLQNNSAAKLYKDILWMTAA